MPLIEDVKGLLVRARNAAGLDQKSAARKAGVSLRTIQGWESGEVSPSVTKFSELLPLYGISTLDDLCRFVAGEKIWQREPEIRDRRPMRDSTFYRAMAEMTERLERLEGIIVDDHKL